jgi:hypothetical protein
MSGIARFVLKAPLKAATIRPVRCTSGAAIISQIAEKQQRASLIS